MKIVKSCTQFVSLFLRVALVLALVSCQTTHQKMEPEITCPLPCSRINHLPSAFPTLSCEERQQAWGNELMMGNAFARECDFYRAITCYKRALILIPPEEIDRRLQLDYELILCYYLGGKYHEALNIFQMSDVSQADSSFPGFQSLLLMIYECYLQTHEEDKASCVLEIIQKFSPETAEDLFLYQTLKTGEIDAARSLISQHRETKTITQEFAFYDQFVKSPRLARTLNALLPGAGYYYIGQRRSAVTSFIINALFTAATYQFFQRGYPAAGAIALSLEMGWYLGGINGAGLEAQAFNTCLYENVSRKILTEHECFPVLMFQTSF